MRTSRALAPFTVSVLVGALGLAGCGDDTATIPAPKPAKPRPSTAPDQDAKLSKLLAKPLGALVAAGCAYGTHPEEEATHVDEAELKWKTFPPASGVHLEQWADYGVYDEAVNDGYLVHNLEHGGVVAWLGRGVSAEQQRAIEDLADKDEKWVIAPREDLEGIAVNAWAKSLNCSPDALEQVEPAELADAVDAWFEAVVSTGSEAEKDLPAYGSGLSEPEPTKNTSTPAPY